MWEYNSLYHHGILGQKWGKRNGPPYPLSSSDHSAAEKKAGWRKSLGQRNSERQKRHDARNRGALSNEELREKIERLKLEKELRNLTNEELNRGKRSIKRFLGEAGKGVAKKYLINAGYNWLMFYTDSKLNGTKFDKEAFAKSLTKGLGKKDSDKDDDSNDNSGNNKKKNDKKKSDDKKSDDKKDESAGQVTSSDSNRSNENRRNRNPYTTVIDVDYEDVNRGQNFVTTALSTWREGG